jgi:hypothetical protein
MSDMLQPLGITCTSTDCDNPTTPTHCFKPKANQPGPRGTCRECGADLIDWPRVHDRNLADIAATFSALENETFRRHIMHAPIPERVRELALRRGVDELRKRTERAIRSALSKPRSQNAYDGRQTPRETSEGARIQHYAQHATATCCRQCLEYWHDIDAESQLSEADMRYCVELAWEYVRQRLDLDLDLEDDASSTAA